MDDDSNMATQRLDENEINRAMREKGLNQAAVAAKLDVSREAVSKWIKGSSFPRPRKLLELANLLEIGFNQLVLENTATQPVAAFRKHKSSKMTEEHFDRAADMGYMLQNLVPYLECDTLSKPSSLIAPKTEHDYVIKAAGEVRKRMQLRNEVVDFKDLIEFFDELHAFLIPVLWGKKELHENAIHIYLPESQTTWIFLNLDTNIIDFKFWMAHELGHVKAPQLELEQAEDFADAFAAELLYPYQFAEKHYEELKRESNKGSIVNKVKKCALQYMVSTVTIYRQINNASVRSGNGDLDVNIYPTASNFSKEFEPVSEILFGTESPTASNYIRISSAAFKTNIFQVIGKYIRDKHKTSGFIQRVLNMPVIDSKEIHKLLVSDEQ